MRILINYLLVYCLVGILNVNAQPFKLEEASLEPVQVSITFEMVKGKDAVKAVKDPAIAEVDQPTFIKIKGSHFRNGTIEVLVLSRLLPEATELARGFIGIAFRINEDNSKFECIYLRPTNARADDQVRRNHTLQYFSYPDYPYTRFRKDSPEKYESYTDMALNEWIKVKIVVLDSRAQLFVQDSPQPCLIVNDLKHGADQSGAIGLWVDVGTEGYFTDLKVSE